MSDEQRMAGRKPTTLQISVLERVAAGQKLCYGINSGWGFIRHGGVSGLVASNCLRRGWVEQVYDPSVSSLTVFRLTDLGRAALAAAGAEREEG